MAKSQPYRPDPKILELGDRFFDPVEAADFPRTEERFFNARWAEKIGLGDLDAKAREAHFGRFEPLPDNLQQPLALRYHGHQFRHYNPELGDGRGFLFAQIRDGHDRLLDLGTKGSGQTPWSRRGDGRLTLKGGVREILATEMLEALGVNTSKSFALYETGEELWRGDEPSPTRSSVLTRLGHGHIRIGTFQRLAYHNDNDGIAALTDYCLRHLYGEAPTGDTAEHAARLFELVVAATAKLAASYMAAGFVHGVLNSDNIAITAESFDYGPWRFTPMWDPAFTAAYFDEAGLYAFARQPEAIQWDVAQLGGVFSLVCPAERLQPALEDWGPQFDRAVSRALLARLGVGESDEDADLARLLVAALATQDATINRVFFDWQGGVDPGADAYPAPAFRALAERLDGRGGKRPNHEYWSDPDPVAMPIETVEALWAHIDERDDWAPLQRMIANIRRMGEAMALRA
ncbi:protein adenylyltransferase SelO family protein [Sphingomicrobium clamense]|uniref:YdiU family protein n=1 Tax=Sphingomicrobium clamense TaxID=2851013 RepID=A0ABS6V7K3_9SPHN|nr:YdiU family protein [Sphingomicrobium sp. B8]MBW0145559.1 YdiU family protein [Sphingomicrobium sp. B8]